VKRTEGRSVVGAAAYRAGSILHENSTGITHDYRDKDGVAHSDMPRLIRGYNEATGVPNTDTGGYHETITLGSLRAARAWLVSRPGVALHEALRELLASDYGRPDWLLAYWSKPVLFSAAARKAWVEPDLQQLPF
jgi:MobA/MobL family